VAEGDGLLNRYMGSNPYPGFESPSLRFTHPPMAAVRLDTAALLLVMLSTLGCASGSQTRLELRGDPRGPAHYQFREMHWRPAADNNAPEFIGYGFIPFRNDPISRDFNSHWPESGFVVFRLHAIPQPDGSYRLTMLGPAMELGPGDDEVLAATVHPASVESSGDTRSITFRDAPVRSRNKPQMSFNLSGTIVAQPTDAEQFNRERQQFDWELNSRRDVAAPPPRPPRP
jgi:hypothetical protein